MEYTYSEDDAVCYGHERRVSPETTECHSHGQYGNGLVSVKIRWDGY